MSYGRYTFFRSATVQIIQIIIIGFSNGYLSTCAVIHLPSHVNGAASKARASSFGMSVGFLGIVAGQWTSKLIKLLIAPK